MALRALMHPENLIEGQRMWRVLLSAHWEVSNLGILPKILIDLLAILMGPQASPKLARKMAERLFDCISSALLRTAIDMHTTYVLALRGNYADTRLRTAQREAAVSRSIQAHFREMERKHRRDNSRRAVVSWGLRDTPARSRPHHYNPHIDETLYATLDAASESVHASPLPPYMARPWC
jgi:hypothetical protein